MKPIQHCIHILSNNNEIINTVIGHSLQVQINGLNNLCIKREGTELRTCSSEIKKVMLVADDETISALEQYYELHSKGHTFDEIQYVLASSRPQLERANIHIIKQEDLKHTISAFMSPGSPPSNPVS